MSEKQQQPGRDEKAQYKWFAAAAGKLVVIKLIDGDHLSGLLIDYDRYTFVLKIKGHEQPVLVQKHAVLYMTHE